MLKKLFSLFSREVTRDKYPKDEYPVWEFVPQNTGKILARVYTNPLQEQTFPKLKDAQKWVHSVMKTIKETA